MKILLVGAGGYAQGYVKYLFALKDPSVVFEGIVDPYFSAVPNKEEITAANIPVYDTMEEFYAKHTADLAIISTPPYLHCEQSIRALENGSYVLCEKPISPTEEEAEMMLSAEKKYGKWIAIGYQWSFSRAIQAWKQDVLDGVLGKPVSMKTAVSWPRNLAYYGRGTGWAGRISKGDTMILDSIASNACAHYLHNMLFILGSRMDESAEITDLEASCFRANDIENFDTCSLKMKVGNVSLCFIASHAAKKRRNPEFVYQFENAEVAFSQDEQPSIKATFRDGRVKYYGDPFDDAFHKVMDCVEAIRQGNLPVCTVKTALPHTKLIGRLYREIPIWDFPKEIVRFDPVSERVFAEGLYEAMYQAYANETLLPRHLK